METIRLASECWPTPAWGWKVIYKRQMVRSLRRPRSGRTEAGPNSCCPRLWPRFRIGGTRASSPLDSQSQVPAGSRPHPRAREESDKPHEPAPRETLGREGCAWCFSCSCSPQGLPPGERSSFRALPDLGSRRGRWVVPRGASPRDERPTAGTQPRMPYT